MGLTGSLAQIALKICPHCNNQYGDGGGKKGHSKKQFMRCLYTANYNLYNVIIELNKLKTMKTKIVVDENDKMEVEPVE